MTDTTTAAVERLAGWIDGNPSMDSGLDGAFEDVAATVRALAAERDALHHDRNQWIANSRENKMIAEANLRERDAALSALTAAWEYIADHAPMDRRHHIAIRIRAALAQEPPA